MRSISAALAASLLLVGCGSSEIHVVPLNPAPHRLKKHPPEAVEVFMSKEPTRPYVEYALIEVQESSALSGATPSKLLEHMRVYAGQRGCDGLILNGTANKLVATGNSGTASLRGYRGTCIVWTTSKPRKEAEPVQETASPTISE